MRGFPVAPIIRAHPRACKRRNARECKYFVSVIRSVRHISCLFDPAAGAAHRALPQPVFFIALGLRPLGGEHAVAHAQGAHLVHALPEADGKARQRRCAEGGRLHHFRAVHRNTQQVGLEAKHHVAYARPAVHAQHGDLAACVLPHGVHQVGHLEGDGLEHRAGDVGARRPARHADDAAARVHIPVRRAEAGEGGHEIDTSRVRHALGKKVALMRGADQPQLVAQPLDGASGVEHAALKRVDRFSAEAPRHRGHKARA